MVKVRKKLTGFLVLFMMLSIVLNSILVVDVHADEVNSLYNVVAEQSVLDNEASEFVTGENGIDFSQSSSDTNGKGVYTIADTKDDKYPIHYYRGDIENNNILFANICWKIVRTTETGGVKLLYNGLPNDGKCNNTGTNSQIGTSKYNNNLNSVAYNGYMYGDVYETKFRDTPGGYHWAKDVTYNDGKYTLVNDWWDSKYGWSYSWQYDANPSVKKEFVNNGYRYNCLLRSHYNNNNLHTEDDYTCSEMNYFFYGNQQAGFYITLKDGKKVDDALKEMRENKNDSAVKQTIDNWYEEKLVDYTDGIEDTVWYNDRQFIDNTGWTLTGHADNYSFYKKANQNVRESLKPSLSYENKNDQFTVSEENGNGSLKYPVGLITVDEATYAGSQFNSSNKNYLASGTTYWTMSPYAYTDHYALNLRINESGNTNDWYADNEQGVRPSISLVNNMMVVSGNGSVDDPYQVKQSHKLTIETEEGLEDYFADYDGNKYIEGEEINLDTLKIGDEVKGYKFLGYESDDVTIDENGMFTMPDKDVVVIAKFEKIPEVKDDTEKPSIKDEIKDIIKNPETSTFVGIAGILFVVSGISFILLKMKKFKKQ